MFGLQILEESKLLMGKKTVHCKGSVEVVNFKTLSPISLRLEVLGNVSLYNQGEF